MLRFVLSAAGSVLAVLLLAAPPQAAKAENIACQTVNGKTVCSRGQGSLACQTVNGNTSCATGPSALTCDTVNGTTTCRRGSVQPDLKPMPPISLPPMAMPPMTMPSMPPDMNHGLDRPFGRSAPFEEEVRNDMDRDAMMAVT